MFTKLALLFITTFALMNTSCSIQQQIRSFNEIISPAANGDVSLTLLQMDSLNKFANPLINRKFQKTKKKYKARFISDTEKSKVPCNNSVINDICAFYQDYWKIKLRNPSANCDTTLYSNIFHYLINKKLTKLSFDELSMTIKDDSELTKVIENEGFYCKFMLINGIQDLLIWDKQSQAEYAVDLPKTNINVHVFFIENYVLRGASDYATFGHSQIGGWASKMNSSLFCNKGTYQLKSEKFQYSYLKHESIHFVDLKNYPNLQSADLEYRAKLVELIYCTEKTIYKRIDEFIMHASSENRENAHPFANYHLICQLSKKLFNNEFESDITKWKSVTPEMINKASLALFMIGTELLKAKPEREQIIEDIYTIN